MRGAGSYWTFLILIKDIIMAFGKPRVSEILMLNFIEINESDER